jgi:eukaryotic-like serine/threonine-protein kinase
MLNETISHYRIAEKLGAGGMGVVYKALDLKLERTVALKFLPQDAVVSEPEKERLLREARAASALDHPNIGIIYGIEESEDGRLFIAMAFYEGETLSHKIARGVLPVREALDLAIQIASGLSAAHARNIVHRDIKPSNIIITKDGVVKIVDFGLARVVSSISATQTMTTTGTLPYMAPEQVLGEAVDQRSDVWALAIILIQMLTGSHPFIRANTAAMTFAILNQPPAALDAVVPLLQPLLYRALSKQPEQRYASAKEFLAELEAARMHLTASGQPHDEPTQTRPIDPHEMRQIIENASTPRWTGKTQRRSGSLLEKVAGVALIALLLTAGSLLFPAVRHSVSQMLGAGSERHIAVLPFDNPSHDPEYEPVAEGLMDSFTSQLSNLDESQQSLWVVPASVVRNRHVSDPAGAFRDLAATMVVQGSVSRKGQNVVLTVNLIDAKRLRQLGSASLEDHGGNLAALQGEAVTRLAGWMKINAPAASLASAKGVAPSAYESYLKALGYMQRYDKPGNLDLAVTALNSAIEMDSAFALGYATRGESYRLKYQMDHSPNWLKKASEDCEKALQMNAKLPAAHVTLGRLNTALGKSDLAVHEFQQALDINPRNADALIGIAGAYERMGRLADAEATFKRAAALRPDYWDGYNSLGNFYDRQNRLQEAITQYRRVVELTPDNSAGYSNLGAEYLSLPDAASAEAAEAALKKSIELVPNYPAYANLGLLYMNQKRYPESTAMTRKALELNDKDWRVWANLLVAYQWLNETQKVQEIRPKTLGLLEQFVALNPQDAQAQSNLSTFYAEDKLREKAIARADTALALSPKDPSVLADVAETYDDLGDRKRALDLATESLKNGYALDDLQRRPGLKPLLADPSFRPGGKQ